MQGCKARTQRSAQNHSFSNPTTNAMQELKRKNNGGGQPITPRSRYNEFPLPRGGMDWWRL
jgi:hypothetical protein